MTPPPLIPAKAGTQIQPLLSGFWARAVTYDLYPGFRRDERGIYACGWALLYALSRAAASTSV